MLLCWETDRSVAQNKIIYGIKEDCITFNHGKGSIIVYLPAEDIVNLKTDQWVTIIGLTNDEFNRSVAQNKIIVNYKERFHLLNKRF